VRRNRRFAKASGKRHWQRGVMNGHEAAYAEHLDTLKAKGHITEWYYEAWAVTLGKNMRLTPDFLVIFADDHVEFHEVKANRKGRWHGEEDAKVKMKSFVDRYPMFPLIVVWPTDRTKLYWHQEEL